MCCLNRPFDDQTHDRIRLEAEAVVAIFKNLEAGNWIWISSSVVLFVFEVNQAPNLDRRRRFLKLCEQASSIVTLNDEIFASAETLKKSGFKSYDALHLACARSADVDVFFSTDDKLIRRAARKQTTVGIRVANPLTWLQEIL